MPKLIDYPRASLKAALELANAIDDLGGSCSPGMAAERTGRKISGAFHALTGATVKYGLIESKAQKLNVTNLYREYKLSYTDDERRQKLRQAMFSVPIFKNIYDRFLNKEIPIAHFDKLLIREFQVPDDLGSRVAGYFIEGAKESGLIDEGNRVIEISKQSIASGESEFDQKTEAESPDQSDLTNPEIEVVVKSPKKYVIRIMGPGMDSNIEINEIEDMLIVQAMLKKVERALSVGQD